MKAFLELSCEVQNRVIDGYEIMTMTLLLERYIMLLNNLGIEAKSYRSYKLKRRLQKRFMNQIQFWHPKHRSQSEIIFSDSIPRGELVEKALPNSILNTDDLSMEATPVKHEAIDNSEIYHCAKLL